MGHLENLADARKVVRNSFDVEDYYSAERDGWDEAYEKTLAILYVLRKELRW